MFSTQQPPELNETPTLPSLPDVGMATLSPPDLLLAEFSPLSLR